jgi:hypothetical protein
MENIDTRVSPSLHPANLAAIEGYGDDTAGAVQSTLAALNTAYSAVGAVHNAREHARTNPTWNEAQQILETAGFAEKQMERVAKSVDAATGSLRDGIASLERELTAPVTSKAALPLSTEIRAHVKAMPAGKRVEFLRQAIDRGDEITASAILGSPSYLSGIDDEAQAIFTRHYHERISPDKAKRLKVMEGAQALMVKNIGLIFKEFTTAVGASQGKVNALRAAKTKAEEAFILRD